MNIFKNQKGESNVVITFGVIAVVIVLAAIVGILMWGLPTYKVWQKELSGKAQLKEAEWNRQIQVQEAQANLDSEILNAKSEVERAKGMAQAIEIENGQLTETYIKYLWVRNMQGEKTMVYIPTEAGLPILEANRVK